MDMERDHSLSNTKILLVNLNRITPPLCAIQVEQNKSLCITQRYAASGIANDNVVTTAIMEYEECEEQ